MIRALFLAVITAPLTASYSTAALADQVVNLPGTEGLDIKFNQFSGYLNVNGSKELHYWLVESEKDPANDPISFWTNGGPGCSGLLGFLTEQGPFRPNKDMTVSLNEYAWNKNSNMVFIEAPCGVGFSYSNNEEDYHTNDAQTAQDNYALIQEFMARFPEFSDNDMYISSESYDTYWGHQLIAKPTYDQYISECVNTVRPNLATCEVLFLQMYRQTGDLNPYALDYPVCVADEKAAKGRMQRNWFLHHQLGDSATAEMRRAVGLPLKGTEDYQPCEEDYATSYLNLPEVKAAIHVKDDIKWNSCSYSLKYDPLDGKNSMVPIYQYLIDGGFGLNILVYSGDDDSVCATIGTQSWIWDMGYEVDGKMWDTYTVNDQTAGYVTKWKDTKLGFVTVHRAGHEVPTYTPEVALDLWIKYLNGEWTNA